MPNLGKLNDVVLASFRSYLLPKLYEMISDDDLNSSDLFKIRI